MRRVQEESGGGGDVSAGLRRALDAVGLADVHCDGLLRLQQLVRANDDDIDPALAQTAAASLAAMCEIASEPLPAGTDPARRATRMAMRIDGTITSPEIRAAFRAIASADAARKYVMLQAAAREAGVPSWSCDAIRDLWPPAP